MYYDATKIDPQVCYRLLVGGIIPRPIAWISTLSAQGIPNLAPYSFFTVASCNPPVLSVTQVTPRGRPAKDTLVNLQESGECVVNIVSAALADAMNATCADYPPEVDEFLAVGIERVPSQAVAPQGVKAAQVRFECRLRSAIEISAAPSGGTIILLDVVGIYVNDSVMHGQQIAPGLLDAVGKLGGDAYATIRERFELARPVLA
jgi:flavin reductase (DIM6/NTAB) family NADH-FMN oxidoreductase RutF